MTRKTLHNLKVSGLFSKK